MIPVFDEQAVITVLTIHECLDSRCDPTKPSSHPDGREEHRSSAQTQTCYPHGRV